MFPASFLVPRAVAGMRRCCVFMMCWRGFHKCKCNEKILNGDGGGKENLTRRGVCGPHAEFWMQAGGDAYGQVNNRYKKPPEKPCMPFSVAKQPVWQPETVRLAASNAPFRNLKLYVWVTA